MASSFLKSTLKRGGEAILAVALVLGLFFLELLLLSRAFPQGTLLGEFVRSPREPVVAMIPRPRGRRGPTFIPAEPQIVAHLTDVYRKVKGRAASHILWDDARAGEALGNRHAVQTFDRSGATIAFNDRRQIDLSENSLVVIRAREAREAQTSADLAVNWGPAGAEADRGGGSAAQGRPSRGRGAGLSLLIAQGDIHTDFRGAGDDAPLDFASGRARSRLVSSAAESDLRVTVNPDRSTTFTVYRGATDVSVEQETARVVTNHFITANPTGPLGQPQELPPIPDSIEPPAGRKFTYSSTPPRIRFAWTTRPAADGYRLQIARDPKFRDLVLTQKVNGGELVHGNLEPGTYYWRVRGTLGWAETLPSEVRALEVAVDRTPPALRVEFPEGPVEGRDVVLRGSAEPNSEVFVLDQRIPLDENGRFEWRLPLPRGATVVVVEALDAAGNATYRSGVLNARY